MLKDFVPFLQNLGQMVRTCSLQARHPTPERATLSQFRQPFDQPLLPRMTASYLLQAL